ncbi:whey acidic protein-like isoform X2 [Tachypleus tridentatus]|uniref:whey acidic protein-like isoform X2 n=1 Tax=Tachypleus tridentatus TaxID=6853 RepID=UPI003FD653E9
MRLIVIVFVFILIHNSYPQKLTFPFASRRRMFPGGGCVDCVAKLKQCVQHCLIEHDCSVSKVKGFCPIGDLRPKECSPIPALNVCESDNDCPGTKKCCKSGCTMVCVNALPRPPSQTKRSRKYNNYSTLF